MSGNRLEDSSLRIAIALRLGAPVCAPQECICGELTDELGVYMAYPVGNLLVDIFVTQQLMTSSNVRWHLLKYRLDCNRPESFAIILVTTQIIKGQMG